jgi:aromatic-L-amino-acid decarboxylase
MRPEALQAAIEQDLAAGNQPCAVVATTGTTTTTALDPLRPIGEIAQANGCGCMSTRPWPARR